MRRSSGRSATQEPAAQEPAARETVGREAPRHGLGALDRAPAGRSRPRPLVARLVVMLAGMAAAAAAAGAVTTAAGSHPVLGLVVGAGSAIAALVLYSWLVRVLEGRRADELRLSALRAQLGRGTASGVVLFSATIGLIALFGGYRVTGWGSTGAAATLGLMLAVATTEELLFRGVLFRLVEERRGTWAALALSAGVFGALHLVNSHATLWGALAISVEAGAMLAAAYAASRTLWLPIGLHLGWNVAEGGLFGAGVSGSDSVNDSVLTGALSGSTALTGGTFGPEASVIALLVCAVPTVLLLRFAARHGRLTSRRAR